MINIPDIYPVDPVIHAGTYMAGLVRSILMRSNFEVHQRQLLGWRGLRPICKGGDGWTCRLDGKEGVYGLNFKQEEEAGGGIRGIFSLCYFPQPEEEIIDQYSIQAALYTSFPQYAAMVRDFLSYPEFHRWFEIGEIAVSVGMNKQLLWTTLTSPERLQLSCTDDILDWIGESSTLPVQIEELNQDLQAFNLAFPFFELFVSTFVVALDNPVQRIFKGSTGDCMVLGTGFGEEGFAGKDNEEIFSWVSGSQAQRPFPCARWWEPMRERVPQSGTLTEEDQDSRPELFVLTGFLGSGKTTFLKQFIEYHVGYKRFVAVIQNEIGAQGLDGKLLEDDYAVLEMDEGCVCCSLVGQLKKGIRQILDKHHPDIIILETTGLANPFNLLGELQDIKDLVRFESVTTIVDGKNFIRSTTYSGIAVDQIKAADQVILNKTDLLSGAQQAEVLDRINVMNPETTIHLCSYGKVNPSQLLGKNKKGSVRQSLHVHHDHADEGIASRKFIVNKRLNKQVLLSEMENLPESIFRVKGVVDIEGQTNPFVLQYVNGSCSLEEMTRHVPDDRFLVVIGKSEVLNQPTIFFNQKSTQ